MGRVFVEHINVFAHQVGCVKLRQCLAELGLVALHHGRDGLVHVDDVEVVVGNHHVGGALVQRVADAQIGVGGSRCVLQRQLHLVNGFGNTRLLSGQTVHGDRQFALRIAGDDIHGFHRQGNVGLHQPVNALRHDAVAPGQVGNRHLVVQHAQLLLLRHLGLRGLELGQHGLHLHQGREQLPGFVVAVNGNILIELAGGHVVGGGYCATQWARDAAHQINAKQQGKQQATNDGRNGQRANGVVALHRRDKLVFGLVQLELEQRINAFAHRDIQGTDFFHDLALGGHHVIGAQGLKGRAQAVFYKLGAVFGKLFGQQRFFRSE